MLFITAIFSGIFYRALNLLSTAPLDSLDTITGTYIRIELNYTSRHNMIDEYAQSLDPCRKHDDAAQTPDISDIPLSRINQILYQ